MKFKRIFMLLLIGSLATVGSSLSSKDAMRIPLQSISACNGKSMIIRCGSSNETVLAEEVVDGVKQIQTEQCTYVSGDCYQVTSFVCPVTQTCTATLISTSPLQGCGKPADYRVVRYYCVPRLGPNRYDICSTTEITAESGIIYSPGNPLYQQMNSTCVTKISVPQGKSLNIYLYDIKIKERNSEGLCDDSLKIIDRSKDYTFCGSEVETLKQTLCSNVIYLSYRAFEGTQPIKRGFALYYETRDVNEIESCTSVSVTPRPPTTEVRTTTQSTTSTIVPDRPLNASDYVTFQVCKGKNLTISAPQFTVVNIEEINYRVQVVALVCIGPTPYDCLGTYPNHCNLQSKCTYTLATTTVLYCQNKIADSITGVYRFIPIASTVKFFVCSTAIINSDTDPSGVIFSKNYPSYETDLACNIRLTSSNAKKAFKVYMTDISIESSAECSESYVQLNDNIQKKSNFCGSIIISKNYTFTSCSNNVDIVYKTTNIRDPNFRGFRIYYELIDYPSECDQFISSTVTNTPITTTLPDVTTPINPISTTITPLPPWAALNMSSGLLTTVSCASNPLQSIKCPNNYIISIRNYFYGKSSQNNCFYSIGDCVGLSGPILRCSGQRECTLPNFVTLINECNALSTYLLVNYECIPTHLTRNRITCGSTYLATTYSGRKGIFTTPSHPSYDQNLNCSVRISTPLRTIIKVYLFETSISNDCSIDSITFYESNAIEKVKVCGQYSADLVYESCSDILNLNIITKQSNDTYNFKGIAFYYEAQNKSTNFTCLKPTITTTTIRPTSAGPSSELDPNLRGFKLFFGGFLAHDVETATKSNTEDEEFYVDSTTKSKSKQSSNLMIGSLAVGLPLLLVTIILIYFINRSARSNGDAQLRVQFSTRNNDGYI